MSIIHEILGRIDQRLKELNVSHTAVSNAAGKPDAIRNIKRSVENGQPGNVTLSTLVVLAEQLDVSLKWLIFGDLADGNTSDSSGELLPAVLEAVEGTYLMLGLDQEEASALVKIVLVAAQEPPTPSAGTNYHRLLAEIEARKFLKAKQQ